MFGIGKKKSKVTNDWAAMAPTKRVVASSGKMIGEVIGTVPGGAAYKIYDYSLGKERVLTNEEFDDKEYIAVPTITPSKKPISTGSSLEERIQYMSELEKEMVRLNIRPEELIGILKRIPDDK
jgi:hypothetical protein